MNLDNNPYNGLFFLAYGIYRLNLDVTPERLSTVLKELGLAVPPKEYLEVFTNEYIESTLAQSEKSYSNSVRVESGDPKTSKDSDGVQVKSSKPKEEPVKIKSKAKEDESFAADLFDFDL